MTVAVTPTPERDAVASRAEGRETALVEHLAHRDIRAGLLQARYHPGLFAERGFEHAVRLSAHVFNRDAEVDRALACIEAA